MHSITLELLIVELIQFQKRQLCRKFFASFLKRGILKRNNLLPSKANCFLFDKNPFQRELGVQKIEHIATDKVLFSSEKCWYLSYFSTKTYVVDTHYKLLAEALLMSTHNICFHREIRKIICGYPLLSVAMQTGSHKRCLPLQTDETYTQCI